MTKEDFILKWMPNILYKSELESDLDTLLKETENEAFNRGAKLQRASNTAHSIYLTPQPNKDESRTN